ncbi:peptide chain release factor N(5)-glutamine methyltransferase [Oceanicaulis sp. AH-315-P02]|nr:peptide chain release factor N(5)-glutamine methyltransferase [Oceanicaulis sp. AH-315-P02]
MPEFETASKAADLTDQWQGLSFAELSQNLQQHLTLAGIDDVGTEARYLLATVFGQNVWQAVADPTQFAQSKHLPKLANLVARRLSREPLPHILGEKGFWTLDLKVNSDVLTPRADTEKLVETALQMSKSQTSGTIIDLGTGSGAVLLAFLSERPNWTGIGVDISSQALTIAKQNAKTCDLAARASFICSNWNDLPDSTYDMLVSNPPYIASDELAALEPEVVKFEPSIALDGGIDGLDAYRCLAAKMQSLLKPQASFALEIGHTQAKQVTEILQRQTCFTDLKVHQDLAGRDRVISGLHPPK